MSDSRKHNGCGIAAMKWTPDKAITLCDELLHRPYMWDDVAMEDPLNALAGMLVNPSIVWYDIGPDYGVLWFDIAQSGVATAHVVVWDRRAYGHAELIVAAARDLVLSHNVHRVQAFIPADNPLAIAFAERCGLVYEGTLRGFGKFAGTAVDAHVYGILAVEHEVMQEEFAHVDEATGA